MKYGELIKIVMKHYTFLLKEKPFKTPASIDFLKKVSQSIATQLLQSDSYTVNSSVDEKNFQAFLDYLTTENYQLELNSDNYSDYVLLNNEFDNIITNILSNPENDLLKKESILNILILEKIDDKSQYEEDIAHDLDFYLNNYTEKMSKIPITSLHNIFNHKNRNLIDHERAYQFIIQNINQNDNDEVKKSFCILIRSLDATKMNEKSVNDLILNQDKHFGFLPKSNDSFICSINKNIDDVKNQIDNKFDQLFSFILNQQQQTFEKITQKFEEKLNSIENKYQLLSNKIDESKQLIENQNNIQNTENERYEEIKNKLQLIQSKVDSIESNFQQISQKIENVNHEKIENKLQPIQSKVDSIESNCQNILQETKSANNEEIKNNLQIVKNKVDSIENNCQTILSKIDIIKNHHFAHFEFDNDPLNGIIHKLTEECGGNVHEKGVVNVTASSHSYYEFDRLPTYVVDFEDNVHYFCSANSQGSWLQYDFINKKVHPTHYTIKTTNAYEKGRWNLINWVIQGSNTGLDNDWIDLDSRENVYDLDDLNIVKTFTIQNSLNQNEYFRYLRIKSTGIDSKNDNFMLFSALEYFGTLTYN